MTAVMEQAAFDFDALMGIERVKEMFSCGIHEQRTHANAHWNECLQLVCLRCGETSPTSFMAELNHGTIEWRLYCKKQIALMNHAVRCRMILDGERKHSPQTNCYAGHDHSDRKNGSYFNEGVPIECVQAEFDHLHEWLTAHRIDAQTIGGIGQFNANIEAAA